MRPKPPKRTRRQVQTGMESSSSDEEPAQKAQATVHGSRQGGQTPLSQPVPQAQSGQKVPAGAAAAAAHPAKTSAMAASADIGRHASSSPRPVPAVSTASPDNHQQQHDQQQQEQQQQEQQQQEQKHHEQQQEEEQPTSHSRTPWQSPMGPSAAPPTPAAPSSSQAAVHSKLAKAQPAATLQQAGQAAAVGSSLPPAGVGLPADDPQPQVGLPSLSLEPAGPKAAPVAAGTGNMSIPQAVAGLKHSLAGLTAAIDHVHQAADQLLAAAEAGPPVGQLGALRDHLQQVLTSLNSFAPRHDSSQY